ncbi:MAG: type II toxin-antitoxin system Phd/YefM family antitoxin [Anaerolineae bacterium]|nr:type II toxin-antitoxin system Phd/YefM family antitoxin [Anaerolineae bacterium]
MAAHVKSSVAQQNFGELMDRALAGEDVVIERYGTPRVVVISFARYQQLLAEESKAEKFSFLPELPELSDEEYERAAAELDRVFGENLIDTGIPDLAHQHDHYLYGTPKKPGP